MATTRRAPSTWRLLFRGITGRCPLCGGRHVFEDFFHIRERCPRCNLSFRRMEGQMVGAVGINTIVTFGVLLIVVVVGLVVTYPHVPAVRLALVGIAVSVLVPILFYPLSWTLWAAVDLAMQPVGPQDQVAPEWLPAARRRRR